MSRLSVRLCGWCGLALLAEVALYWSYRDKDARFHWFTHFFVGAGAALVVMALIALASRTPIRFPLLWPVAGHLIAMFPDFLFQAGVAHQRWMDLFLLHISSHYVAGANWTWLGLFLLALLAYLLTLDRIPAAGPRQDNG